MNRVISIVDSYAYRPMIWGIFVPRIVAPEEGIRADEALITNAITAARTCCRALEDLLAAQRYFAGDEVTLADLHATPILLYFAMTPEGENTLTAHPRLRRWLTAMTARPSVQRTQGKFELPR